MGAPDEAAGGQVYGFSHAGAHQYSVHGSLSAYFFGFAVAMGAATLAVGAYGEAIGNLPFAGRVYVFDAWDRSPLGTLTQTVPQTYRNFGYSVAVSGPDDSRPPSYVVGAIGSEALGPMTSGQVFVFPKMNPGSTIACPNPSLAGNFGWAVGAGDEYGIVGTPAPTTRSLIPQPGGKVFLFGLKTGHIVLSVPNSNEPQNDFFGQAVGAGRTEFVLSADSQPPGSAIASSFF